MNSHAYLYHYQYSRSSQTERSSDLKITFRVIFKVYSLFTVAQPFRNFDICYVGITACIQGYSLLAYICF